MEDKQKRIDIIAVVIFFGFMAGALFSYVASGYFHLGYPYDTFLFNKQVQFSDVLNSMAQCSGMDPYFSRQGPPSNYFPFLNIITFVLSLLPGLLPLILVIGAFISSIYLLGRSFILTGRRHADLLNLAIVTLLTYPVLFVADRGNLEMLGFVLVCAFVYLFQKEKYALSAAFLAGAIAMKLFPAVFLLFFMSRKRYKEALLAAGYAIALTFVSLLFHKGGFLENLNFMLSGFNVESGNLWLGANNVVQRGVSLFTFIKVLLNWTGWIKSVDMGFVLSVYKYCIIGLSLAVSYAVVFAEKKLWRQTLLVTLMFLLFPHISADYKLIYMLVPLMLFVDEGAKKGQVLWALLLALVMVPKSYYILGFMSSDGGTDISIGVIINVLLLSFMLAYAVFQAFQEGPIAAGIKDHLYIIKSNRNWALLVLVLVLLSALYTARVNGESASYREHFSVAVSLFNAGNIEGAILSSEKAVASKKEGPDAHHLLAIAYFRNGRLEESMSEIVKARQLAPDDANIQGTYKAMIEALQKRSVQ